MNMRNNKRQQYKQFKTPKSLNSGTVIVKTIQFISSNKLRFLTAITILGFIYVPVVIVQRIIKTLYTLSAWQYHIFLLISTIASSLLYLLLLGVTYQQLQNSKLYTHEQIISSKLKQLKANSYLNWFVIVALIDGIWNYIGIILYNTSYNFIKVDNILQKEVALDINNAKGLAETILFAVAAKSTKDEIQKMLPLINRENAFWFILTGTIIIICSWLLRYFITFITLEKMSKKGKIETSEAIVRGTNTVLKKIKLIAGTDILIEAILLIGLLVIQELISPLVEKWYIVDLIKALSYTGVVFRCYCYGIINLESVTKGSN